ncbi:DUF4194 domain-containing protein [Pseudoduganella sp. R-31]|uniref:DUF4194 domain-containing protein n=1 Tax=unclassified Pseudoduganella TaxID=2637179 RepID=UPI003CE868B9
MDNLQQAAPDQLSVLSITLLKGVLYREADERLWSDLLNLQSQVRDYMAVLRLELALDEAEGYAFLRPRAASEDEGESKMPRLMARRPLSFPVSLLLALLRKKLAEFDASGGTRLVLTRDDIVQMVALFMPSGSNESRIVDQIETHINKVVDLGFLRVLKQSTGPASYEVKRILKAFVDAQWLAEFDSRLDAYRKQLAPDPAGEANA